MKYIKGFDGLRAISILFVISGHLGLYQLIESNSFLQKNYNLFSGTTGVKIFFSISGFLITILLLNEKKLNGRIQFLNFFTRRVLRLAPPLLIFFSIIYILMHCNLIPADYTALLFSFFYVYNFVPIQHYIPELAHTWSLGIEEQFYFFWPFVISLVRKMRVGIIFALLVIGACLTLELLYITPLSLGRQFYVIASLYFVERWFLPACLPIIIGGLAGMVLFSQGFLLQKALVKNYFFLVLPALFFVAQIFIPTLQRQFIDLLQPVGISLFLLWVYFNQESFLVKLLEYKPLAFLGKISYGVYVYQGLFLRNSPGGNLLIQKFPINISLVFITALLSYYFVERKIMRFKDKFKSKKKPASILEAAVETEDPILISNY